MAAVLIRGQNCELNGVRLGIEVRGGVEVAALVCDAEGTGLVGVPVVTRSAPAAPGISLGPVPGDPARLLVDLAALPPGGERIAVLAISAGDRPIGAVTLTVDTDSGGPAAERVPVATFVHDGAEGATALVLGEVYRRGTGWKLRAVGQGFESGAPGLATHLGVDAAALAIAPDSSPGPPVTEDRVPDRLTHRSVAVGSERDPAPKTRVSLGWPRHHGAGKPTVVTEMLGVDMRLVGKGIGPEMRLPFGRTKRPPSSDDDAWAQREFVIDLAKLPRRVEYLVFSVDLRPARRHGVTELRWAVRGATSEMLVADGLVAPLDTRDDRLTVLALRRQGDRWESVVIEQTWNRRDDIGHIRQMLRPWS